MGNIKVDYAGGPKYQRYVGFLIDGVGYEYEILDELAFDDIQRQKAHKPGTCLDIAKKHGRLAHKQYPRLIWIKNLGNAGREWKEVVHATIIKYGSTGPGDYEAWEAGKDSRENANVSTEPTMAQGDLFGGGGK